MTTGRGDGETYPAGGPPRHIPVLLSEAVAALAPRSGGLYLDGTFGAGGYTRALLARPGTTVIALDRDPAAIAAGRSLVAEAEGRLTLVQTRFGALGAVAAAASLDGAAFDIGVSSMQFDEGARGFSFRFDGPLDMRMEQAGPSAADLVNMETEERLADIFYYYGEDRAARRLARAVVAARQAAPIVTTRALADTIARVAPGRPGDIHPATRAFQGLRIAVNDELGELVRALAAAEQALKPGGVLAVVSFHSLEDRLVKHFFAARSGRGAARSRLLPGEPLRLAPTFTLEGAQPIAPSAAEIAANPRARSAKLRFARRTDAPAREPDAPLLESTRLPERSPPKRTPRRS